MHFIIGCTKIHLNLSLSLHITGKCMFVFMCICMHPRANVGVLNSILVCMSTLMYVCMYVTVCVCGPLLAAVVQPKSMRGRYSRTMGYV